MFQANVNGFEIETAADIFAFPGAFDEFDAVTEAMALDGLTEEEAHWLVTCQESAAEDAAEAEREAYGL